MEMYCNDNLHLTWRGVNGALYSFGQWVITKSPIRPRR